MVFKINISHKGKTIKFDEVDNEALIDKIIGEKIDGKDVSGELAGYELEITGTSDKAGFPGLPNLHGPELKKVLLKKGRGMKDKRKGIKLRKTVRGNTISANTVQINAKVIKEGNKKFSELFKKEEQAESSGSEEKKEENT